MSKRPPETRVPAGVLIEKRAEEKPPDGSGGFFMCDGGKFAGAQSRWMERISSARSDWGVSSLSM